MPAGYSKEEAQKTIRGIAWSREGELVLTWHIEKESSPSRDFDFIDVLQVLRTGCVVSEPEYIAEYKNWKCRVVGRDMEGEELTLVVAFDPDKGRLFIITGW
ncbi:MAG: DUF4258 domain-containing protein [Syntrophobacteria bacterium]